MKPRCLSILFALAFLLLACAFPAAAAAAPPELTSQSALLFDPASGQILYSKNPDAPRAPASLTKISTVMTALSLCADPDHENITVPEGIFDEIYAVGGSHVDLAPGEVLTATQLMYAAMLPSACDAASVLAYHFGNGDISAFVEKMNAFARSCGAENTHYVNAHGLDAAGHLSTARDIAAILRVALQNEFFNRIISTTRYLIPATDYSKPREITYETTIPMLYTYNDNYYEGLRGIKSGTTLNAGCCLSTLCEKNGTTLLALCMGAGRDENGANLARVEVLKLFDWGFENFVKTVGVRENERYATVALEGATESEVALVTRRSVSLLKDRAASDLYYEIEAPQSVSPPFSDESVGILHVSQNGMELISEPLYFEHLPQSADPAAEGGGHLSGASAAPDLTLWILIAVVAVLLILFWILQRAAHKNLTGNGRKGGGRP